MHSGENQDKSSSAIDVANDDEVGEDLFIQNPVQLASSGELCTLKEVKKAYLDAFGQDFLVSGDFVYNLIHLEATSTP
jgi:hypothetical protein